MEKAMTKEKFLNWVPVGGIVLLGIVGDKLHWPLAVSTAVITLFACGFMVLTRQWQSLPRWMWPAMVVWVAIPAAIFLARSPGCGTGVDLADCGASSPWVIGGLVATVALTAGVLALWPRRLDTTEPPPRRYTDADGPL